jgi:protein phosphatase 1G
MGVYLSTPKTEKVSEDGENDKLKFGLSSMQGWRATMEDAVSFYSSFTFACFDLLVLSLIRLTWIQTHK